MIPFIEPKPIDWNLVRQNLVNSFEQNHFANRGPATLALEKYISENVLKARVGVCAVSTGTAALNIAATHFSELKKSSLRWLVSANGFFSTILGPFSDAQVVDCSKNGLIDISLIKQIPTESYDGIVFTNLFGFFSEFNEIIDHCIANNKILIFDNAASLGTLTPYYQKLSNSQLNWAETISFHHTKPWGIGEGGCIIFDTQKLSAEALNSVANFGRFSSPHFRHAYDNYKLSDFAAALILHRLQTANEWAPRYEEQCSRLMRIANKLGLKPIALKPNSLSTHGHLPIFFENKIGREALANPYVVLQKYYEPLNNNCTNAVEFFSKMVSFPCHEGVKKLADVEIEAVLEELKSPK